MVRDAKVAVITGAASGIGLAVAHRLARDGMKLVLADINEENLEDAVRELRSAGAEVSGVVTDVSSADSVQALADETFRVNEHVDLLFNNAGVEGYLDGAVWEATPNDWAWTMGVNFWGVVYIARAFLPRMIERDAGRIINTASAAGFVMPSAMYSISKHAVVAFSELLYTELAQRESNVRVSVLCPGEVDTGAPYGIKNRPAALVNAAELQQGSAGASIREKMSARRGHPRAKSPGEVADLLADAVQADQFYIFTDHEWDERIKRRFDHILQRANPALPDDPVALAILSTIRERASRQA
jgi:NAD(P)-dependent dehydrogenase (short-subunit alcohol dehydrogenase family)